MVTIAIYKPVFRSLKGSLTDIYVKDHKRALLNQITAKCKDKELNKFLESHFDTSYSDGFSHKNITLVLGNDCHNKRLKDYDKYINSHYRDYIKTYKSYGKTSTMLPVDCVFTKSGEFATAHFYNRPCTMFMAFNRAKAGSLINYWIKPKYRETFLQKLDQVWEDGMIMEIVF